ncbi:hypothetical protein [Nocardioides sp. Kera G14]|uniref:hypothetical protein n=1 Tax=Nocardioides sp. Kera G14 TaxID=2884264 RepID=UPI001D11BE39|nr:hypothetical protein [Nocardioides sp. Kera G14]UDY22342.1 hypothetical protein LH076_09635 [Nocardioides sp. Kera G14]
MGVEHARLAKRLGVPETRLAALQDHRAEDLARLDAVIDRAMESEDRAFDGALDEALRFVPRLVRGPAQKLLFPGGRRG